MNEIVFNTIQSPRILLAIACLSSFRLYNHIKDIWLAFCAVYIVRKHPEGQMMHFLETLYSYQIKLKQNNTFLYSGIINLLFDGLTYNTRGHFAHCPCGVRKNTAQLAKYPRVLYVKPSNTMYLLHRSL